MTHFFYIKDNNSILIDKEIKICVTTIYNVCIKLKRKMDTFINQNDTLELIN